MIPLTLISHRRLKYRQYSTKQLLRLCTPLSIHLTFLHTTSKTRGEKPLLAAAVFPRNVMASVSLCVFSVTQNICNTSYTFYIYGYQLQLPLLVQIPVERPATAIRNLILCLETSNHLDFLFRQKAFDIRFVFCPAQFHL